MLTKLTAFLMSIIMFFSSTLPGLLRDLGIGNKVEGITDKITDYVEQNFPALGDAFEVLGEAFKASTIENAIDCTLIHADGTTEEATYIDFNGNFGYIIMTPDHFIHAYKGEGDLKALKNLDMVYYSLIDGFVYLNENGEYVPYDIDDYDVNDRFTYQYIEDFFNYVSQDGALINPDEYVKEQYGAGYALTAEYELPDFNYSTQMSTSVYREIPQPGWWTSEGNCSLHAIYAFLNYIKEKSGDVTDEIYSALPASTQKAVIYADQDPFFDEFKDNLNYDIMGYDRDTGVCKGFEVPALYNVIRTFCCENYGYTTGGTSPSNFKYIVQNVFDTYNVKGKYLKEHTDYKTFSSVIIPHLKNGYPVLWDVNISTTYGSHTTVTTGYKIYTKTVEVNGFKITTDRVTLLRLNDNWAENGSYFDYTRYTINCGTFYTVDN